MDGESLSDLLGWKFDRDGDKADGVLLRNHGAGCLVLLGSIERGPNEGVQHG